MAPRRNARLSGTHIEQNISPKAKRIVNMSPPRRRIVQNVAGAQQRAMQKTDPNDGSQPQGHDLSIPPAATFQLPPASFGAKLQPRKNVLRVLKPFNSQDIKILLLENVNQYSFELLNSY
ncbi:hypothetical protein TRIATDRAFT_91930 [Trichoderma atroviride IMI 206040]|uniref:Uncharacterized protein n=1 Tax=Hypocrea atroviridis (strain ATCC 20476 / IMI 206040) TaxID=452589 RepID=G9PC47_HYPAI|nr:uncharacterized protein TRIATDRAFT_91930 [Trichoderma atroviride IMI 206040]EHK39429.1 hypothetical protein TRIATDRAFT_91930 [Trichoderma atroviride IMI 206040]